MYFMSRQELTVVCVTPSAEVVDSPESVVQGREKAKMKLEIHKTKLLLFGNAKNFKSTAGKLVSGKVSV